MSVKMTTAILASILAACVLAIVAAFQVLLALAMPFGNAAWGGAHRVLPPHLRLASAISVAPLVLAAWIVLARTGVVTSPWKPATVSAVTWVGFAILVLSTVGNSASKSRIERIIMAPVAFVCSVCFLVVALSDHS
ncbi:conserved membrane hypothetical protein [Candidatus Sulfotelmatobacter sp. SbA7]|nr:conserved membrane hypothetical protein [Candidatus Sulfotelmatobacter sp. SbA7]